MCSCLIVWLLLNSVCVDEDILNQERRLLQVDDYRDHTRFVYEDIIYLSVRNQEGRHKNLWPLVKYVVGVKKCGYPVLEDGRQKI